MSLVIVSGSKQYLVDSGQQVIVDRLNGEEGQVVELPVVHTIGEDQKSVDKVKVKILKHQKGEKIRILKYKAKSNYKRQYGYRHFETLIEILKD